MNAEAHFQINVDFSNERGPRFESFEGHGGSFLGTYEPQNEVTLHFDVKDFQDAKMLLHSLRP